MSAEQALKRYYQRQARQASKRRRTNGRPEWELVKKPILAWAKDNGWCLSSIESRAVYDPAAGRYVHGMAVAGTADLFGNAPCGTAVYLELKAPGRRSTLKPHQHDFLVQRISTNAFAGCIDSLESFIQLWDKFKQAQTQGASTARDFLLGDLPQRGTQRNPFRGELDPLF